MKTNIHFWPYLAQFFLEHEMFRAKVVEKIKTHILCSITFLKKSCHPWDNVMARAHCTLYNYSCKHTLRICNSYCFSTAKIAARTRHIVIRTLPVLLFSNVIYAHFLGEHKFGVKYGFTVGVSCQRRLETVKSRLVGVSEICACSLVGFGFWWFRVWSVTFSPTWLATQFFGVFAAQNFKNVPTAFTMSVYRRLNKFRNARTNFHLAVFRDCAFAPISAQSLTFI
jgi:hypothetical protein